MWSKVTIVFPSAENSVPKRLCIPHKPVFLRQKTVKLTHSKKKNVQVN